MLQGLQPGELRNVLINLLQEIEFNDRANVLLRLKVVEVSGFVEHQLSECDRKAAFRQCERCKEAVPTKKYNLHVKVKTCPGWLLFVFCHGRGRRTLKHISFFVRPFAAVKNGDVHCPLCHLKINSSDDEGWKRHLTAPMECAFNPRRKDNPLSKSMSRIFFFF